MVVGDKTAGDKVVASSVKTAGRTLDVFEAFGAAGEPLSLTELAERIGSPVSSCHALVKTLQARGYVYTLDQRRRIYPTKRLLEIASEIAANDPLLRQIEPLMVALRDETGETIIMGKRQANEVIYLEVVDGSHTIRYTARPGDTKPLHSSSIGKAMLSLLTPAGVRDALKKGLDARTPNTITDIATLQADLDRGRADGFFVTRGENVVEVMAIAVAVRVAGENLGFALAGPMPRVEAEFTRYRDAMGRFRDKVAALTERIARFA